MKYKKIFFLILFILFVLTNQSALAAATTAKTGDLAKKFSGRILIQVESYGRSWYVYPKDKKRYYLKDGQTAYDNFKNLALKIEEKELAKIPIIGQKAKNYQTVAKYKGYFLVTEKDQNKLWYVNPVNNKRYLVNDSTSAYKLLKDFGMGIKNKELKKIAMNDSQIAWDGTFSDVAYVKYDGQNFTNGYYADKILPLASLTKLVTALVLLDLNLDWQKKVVVTKDQLDYPKLYVGDDTTSEIKLIQGDQVSLGDLWIAMLLASSNQAAGILADATGLSKDEFVKLMNTKAKELGLKKTLFCDVSGLNAHNVTTAKEMALIAYKAFSIPKIANTSVLNSYLINAVDILGQAKTINVVNRNYSLLKFNPQGAKTGFLVEAQRTVAIKENSDIIVVMHALSMKQRNNIINSLIN